MVGATLKSKRSGVRGDWNCMSTEGVFEMLTDMDGISHDRVLVEH